MSNFLIGQSFWFRLAGGVFLLFLGLRAFLLLPPQNTAFSGMKNLWGIYVSTLLLTLTNPMTILSFAAFFAGFGFGAGTPTSSAVLLVVGVFLGSSCWWLLLSSGAGLLRGALWPSVSRMDQSHVWLRHLYPGWFMVIKHRLVRCNP